MSEIYQDLKGFCEIWGEVSIGFGFSFAFLFFVSERFECEMKLPPKLFIIFPIFVFGKLLFSFYFFLALNILAL